MATTEINRRTPITSRVDRSDGRIRMIEEAVLLIRGEWPAVACGLCETVNRATGLIVAPPKALDETIEQTAGEAERLVEALYGHEAILDVKRLAAVGQDSEGTSAPHRAFPRRRVRLPAPSHRRLRFHGSR